MAHVCPWWGGYFIDHRFRRWLHPPEQILAPYLRPGITAMDFGCGMGFTAIAMARMLDGGGQVIAVDLQQQMLDVLRQRADRAGVSPRIRTHRCEADQLGLDEPLDFTLAFYSVHEVPDARRLLREVHRLLRPDGQFLVVEPRGHVTAQAFRQLLADAEAIGFLVDDPPAVRWSHTALLRRPPADRC